jgi:transcriptional regulator with XRE-family HTH domain
MTSTIGGRIKDLRERKGFSQAELVDGLPVAACYVSLIEHGKRNPTDKVLGVLAKRLGCTVEYLVTGRNGPGAQELELQLRFAELALRSGDPKTARDRFSRVVNEARDLGLDDIEQDARWGLSRADEGLNDLESAIEGLESLNGEPVLKGSFTRTALARRLSHTYLECRELTRAIEVAEAGLAHSEQSDAIDSDELSELASTLVACYYERGDLSRAHLLVRRMIEDAERADSPRARAAAYWNAGIVAEGRGELRNATLYTERALALYGEVDNARAAATLRLNCAWLMLRSPEPDLDEITALLCRAISELSEVGTPADVARAETELARCRLLQGDAHGALTASSDAVARLSDNSRLENARAKAVRARAQLAVGDVDAAAASLVRAASDLGLSGNARHAAPVWRELADDFLALGMIEEAVIAYQQTADAAGVPRPPQIPRITPAAEVAIRPAR